MEEEFNYLAVPYGYSHCFNAQCVKGEKCLHHLVGVHSTDHYPNISIVNPKSIPEDTSACPFFRSAQKIHVAWGVQHLFDNIPHKDATILKRLLLSHFGRGLYYRFYRKECYISPGDQNYIHWAFCQKGVSEQPVFDSFTDEYKW